MKLSALLILAGAGLLQVNASPLRVVFIASEASSLGSTSVEPSNGAAALPPTFHHIHTDDKNNGTRRGCAGARLRQKSKSLSFSISISNTIRHALGMPLIENDLGHNHHSELKDGEVRVHKHHWHSHHHHEQSEDEIDVEEEDSERPKHSHHHHKEMQSMDDSEEGPIHHKHHHKHHFHGKGGFHFKGQKDSFLRRLHFSLMALGPWEGRAVAFVLGCGLGVLLRMFWVLTVVAYRTIKGSRQEEEISYVPVLNQYDAEEIFVSPPVYIVDEKAPLKEDLKAAEETN